MVLKTELCRFSGAKISLVFLFANSKCKRYFHSRLKPSKLAWTAMYRKQHKKDVHAETVKKRRRTTKKPYSRSIVGATLEVIQKRRTEKAEVRDAAREAALREGDHQFNVDTLPIYCFIQLFDHNLQSRPNYVDFV
ncbi:60S ribosomal protein L24-like isoform X2 [Phoenix dactylifera]|uniref:60S ribosomal protein L24-like isoform X2 n=1 Tax=Phoenix dactylifera TaxID=42345 RepID=A0A8B8IYP8_PHODC|nr:60S ribosomal protein L24-like isoform X2 [Phoenix dactylifera]